MFDSHCHLHDTRIADAAPLLARARAIGVRGFLLAGVEPDGWRAEARLARAHADVVVAYGVHPQLVAALDDAACDRMVDALGGALDGGVDGVRAVALGEIGLDGLGERRASLPRQERIFRRQLALARARDLPVMLHILRAHPAALRILDEEGLPAAGGVVHSYSGSADEVRRYVALGLHLSIAGPVTFAGARKTRAAAAAVPAERLLVETDAPDQTPEPHRPAPNEPAFLPEIVAAVAALRGAPAGEIARLTDDNARRLLRL